MKAQTATILASLLSTASAAPTGTAECVVSATSTCTTITTTITTTSSIAECIAAPPTAATTTNAATITPPTATTAAAAASGLNIQSFTGTLGGSPPPVISGTGKRPFTVNSDTFVGSGAALGRSCDVQHNACANAANSGQLSGGVGRCDQQNTECHQFNKLAKKRHLRARTVSSEAEPIVVPRALDLGSCKDTTILFENGLDGRNTPAFVAADQKDFNHGSALNIAVIAGFICQRLGSPCNAAQDAQAQCSMASAAAVATTQNQVAADVFNGIMGGAGAGAGGALAVAATATDLATTTALAGLAGLQTGIVVQTITSCT